MEAGIAAETDRPTRGLHEEDLTDEERRIMQAVDSCVVWRTLLGSREPERVKLLVAIALEIQETVESQNAGEKYKGLAKHSGGR